MAGQGTSCSAVATDPARIHFGLLGDLQIIGHLDLEIPEGAFEVRVPQNELNSPETPGTRYGRRLP